MILTSLFLNLTLILCFKLCMTFLISLIDGACMFCSKIPNSVLNSNFEYSNSYEVPEEEAMTVSGE